MALKVSNHMWVKHWLQRQSRVSTPVWAKQAALAVKGSRPASQFGFSTQAAPAVKDQHPLWVKQAALAVKDQHPLWVKQAALAVKDQNPLWVKQAALAVKDQHPCMGQAGCIGSQGWAPMYGSRRLHWQSRGQGGCIGSQRVKQAALAVKGQNY